MNKQGVSESISISVLSRLLVRIYCRQSIFVNDNVILFYLKIVLFPSTFANHVSAYAHSKFYSAFYFLENEINLSN